MKGVSLSREHKKDCPTPSRAKTILAKMERETAAGKRNYATVPQMITIMLGTIEVGMADIKDLQIRGEMTVLYIQGKGKDEKARYVKIVPKIEDVPRQYLDNRDSVEENQPLFRAASNNSEEKRLGTRGNQEDHQDSHGGSWLQESSLTAHSLHHAAVILSLLEGNTSQEVQGFARHSNMATAQVYAQNLDRDKNQCEKTITENLRFRR